jgi:hypothetical protein
MVKKLPAHAQLGFLTHAMNIHDRMYPDQQAQMQLKAQSVARDLKNSIPNFEGKVRQIAQENGIPHSNSILAGIAGLSERPEELGFQLSIKNGSAALRKLRDHIESVGGSVLPNELPSGQRWSTVTTPITDRNGNVNHVLDWNAFRKKDGKISAESVQRYIDRMPSTTYDFSMAPYQGDQMHSGSKPQQTLRLKISESDLAKLRATGADKTLAKLTDLGKQSGHPVEDRTIGWVRFSTGPDGHFIDETQSDLDTNFESSLRQQLKQAYGEVPEDAYQMHLRRVRDMFPVAHIQQIKDLVFGKKASSEILHEAFQEYMRRNGHVGSDFHVHSSVSKAPMANMDMAATLPGHMKLHYEETPKAIGTTPANYGTLEVENDPQYGHLAGARLHGEKIRKFEE